MERPATDLFEVEDVALLAMPNASLTEARGIVGMEMFSQGRLEFDLTANRLTLGRRPGRPALSQYRES